jgi:hypothetical protein
VLALMTFLDKGMITLKCHYFAYNSVQTREKDMEYERMCTDRIPEKFFIIRCAPFSIHGENDWLMGLNYSMCKGYAIGQWNAVECFADHILGLRGEKLTKENMEVFNKRFGDAVASKAFHNEQPYYINSNFFHIHYFHSYDSFNNY